jgi:hypothetical protein
LDDPQTPGRLSALGVRYVVLKHDKFNPFSPDPGKPGKGLALIQRSSFADLYRVTAPPAPEFESGTGFGGEEGNPGARFRWAQTSPAILAVSAKCSPCAGKLRFRSTSFNGRPRRVVIRQDGRVIATKKIKNLVTISFPIRFDKRTELVFEFAPGPEAVARAMPGSTDPRSLGISVQEPRFRQSDRP